MKALIPARAEHAGVHHRVSTRAIRKFGVIAIMVMTLLLAACTSATSPPTTTATSTTTQPSTTSTSSTTTTKPAAASSLAVEPCGPAYVSKSDQTTLARSFGPDQECFLNVGTDTWVDMVSASSSRPSPGGAVVLVDACQPKDATCLDSDVAHPLSAFMAYPAPDPRVVGMSVFVQLPASATQALARDGALLVVSDRNCGPIVFDLDKDRWYGDSVSSADALIQGNPAEASLVPSAPGFPADQLPPPKASLSPACHA